MVPKQGCVGVLPARHATVASPAAAAPANNSSSAGGGKLGGPPPPARPLLRLRTAPLTAVAERGEEAGSLQG